MIRVEGFIKIHSKARVTKNRGVGYNYIFT